MMMDELLQLDRYPLAEVESAGYRDLVAHTRARLAQDGCAVLRGFVRPDAVPALVTEAESVSDKGHRSFNRTNAYFTKDDPTLSPKHPVRRFYDRSNSFVPADNFGDGSLLRAIYEWPYFPAFIQQALGEKNFYRYADPLADVIINQAEEGEGFPWHFDTNNYTVTLCIQNSLDGGAFEYAPSLRSAVDENYDGVAAVLDGNRQGVKTLHLQAGDLQIFKGRYSLHRVAPLRGPQRRYVAIFSYVEQPNMVGSPERTQQLYGRVLPIHRERHGERADSLLD